MIRRFCRHLLPRLIPALASMCLATPAFAVEPPRYTGLFENMYNCPPPSMSPAYMCQWITMTLTQDGTVICGEFQAQEEGGSQEGTISGVVVGRTAVVAITGADASIVLGRLERNGRDMWWQKVWDLKDRDPDAQTPSGVPDATNLRWTRQGEPPRKKCAK